MLNTLRARRAELKKMYRDVVGEGTDATYIHLPDKRAHRVSFVSGMLRELPAVFTVIVTGVSAVQGEHDGASLALAAAELITGAAVLITVGFEARHLFGRSVHHSPKAEHDASARVGLLSQIGAANIAAAAMGFVEALHRAHVHGYFKVVSPQVFGAVTSLVVGYLQHRPRNTRRKWRRGMHVAVTPKGIVYLAGLRGPRRWSAHWTDVAAVEHNRGELAVRLHDGSRHVISAERHVDGEGVLARTREAIAQHAPHVPGAVGGVTAPISHSSAHSPAMHAH